MNVQTTNAITAALIERTARLRGAIHRLEGQAASQDRDFALSANQEALRDTTRALEQVSREVPDSLFDPAEGSPDPIDEAKSWHDWQAAGPR